MKYTKKFLLINPRVSDDEAGTLRARFFPLGLGIVGSILEQRGIQVGTLDLRYEDYTREEVISHLERMVPEYDVIGISAIVNSLAYVKWLSEEIKRIKPSVTVVLGGSATTSVLDLAADMTRCDIFCVGEGEDTIVELAECFEGRMALSDVNGIGYWDDDGKFVHNIPRARIQELDAYPLPAYHLFNTEGYVNLSSRLGSGVGKNLTIIAGRGCPFQCTYCLPAFGRTLVMRSASAIVDEIRMLKETYGVQHIDFIDDLLCFKESWMREFAETLYDARLDITWRGLGRANIFHRFDEETIRLMKASGCHWLGFGFESGSQKILDLIKKKTTVEQMQKTVDLCRKFQINVTGTFILGMPGETEETIAETEAFVRDNYLWPAFSFACPYPGTELYDYAKAKGLLGDEASFIMKIQSLYEVYISVCDFSIEELKVHHRRITSTLGRRLRGMGITSPTMLMGFETDESGVQQPILGLNQYRGGLAAENIIE